ncbi:hypothetical protein [Blastococcus colisei]|uniref:hypothetical protein n=1 Tax=Blastococcus colisei TaxID=1564162 RepID=UPI001FEAC6A2|nr:hypothetical protein [Blastococcus colisei]
MLAAGMPYGRLAWGGQHVVLPRNLRISSAVSVLFYVMIAGVVLQAAGVPSFLPAGFSGVWIWVLVGYFPLGVVMNAASRSRAERLVMTPVALLLGAACLLVALG